MTETKLRLERVNEEQARIFAGPKIVGWLTWTDSFWVLSRSEEMGDIVPFPDLAEIGEMGDAFLRSFEHLGAASADLDFFLDPPTFVGPTEGERACWVYTVWKRFESGSKTDMREWSGSDYAAATQIYRRARRKYGDSPPDKTTEVKEAMA